MTKKRMRNITFSGGGQSLAIIAFSGFYSWKFIREKRCFM